MPDAFQDTPLTPGDPDEEPVAPEHGPDTPIQPDEPAADPDDTQPRPPAGLREALAAEGVEVDLDSDTPVIADAAVDADPDSPPASSGTLYVPSPAGDLPVGDASDTEPKAPRGLREAIAAQQAARNEALLEQEPPIAQDDTAPVPVRPYGEARPGVRPLLLAVVMLGTTCLCAALIGLASFAGYRDGLATNNAQITQTLATGIAEQYATGVADLENERYALAAARFSWIVETIQPAPEYMRDSAALLAQASTQAAYTPTPPPAPTATPTLSPTPTLPPTEEAAEVGTEPPPDGLDPAYLYDQAAAAMSRLDFEDAIEWIESLMAVDPAHRPAETQAMYLEALTTLGRQYIRGANPDGEDRLARGIRLIYRADEIGTVEPPSLLYEADFAERYLNARNAVAGGHYESALPVLQTLCAENCEWGYRGVTVRTLLEQAGGTAE